MILGKSLSKSLGVSLGKSFAGGDTPVVYHTVTFSCTHGTVIATVDGVEIQTGAQVEHGKSVVFTIYPSAHYHYHYTNPETVVVNDDVTKSYTCDIDVFFVTFSCTNGSVGATVDGIGIQSGGFVDYGKTVVFTITPDEGYEYTGTNPESVVVHDNVTKSYECTPAVAWTGLKFTSDGTNTVWLYGDGAWLMDDNEDVTPNPNISHNCEYSIDGTTWVTMPITLATAVSFTGTMYVRGNNSAGWGDESHAPSFRFGGSGHVSVAGNIFSLLDNGAGTITTMPSNSCMPYLFGTKDSWGMDLNTCITDASGLVLPDASQIYSFGCLFRNCPGLVNASFTLPTTIGRSSCYYMFYDCTGLTTAPALPATTLAYGCYSFMFQNCTHLEGPVNISATSPLVSGERACSDMFTNSGTVRVGTNRIIYVGGNVSDWNLANCGINSAYWTPLTGLKFTSDGTNTVYLPKGTWLTEGELPSETNVSQNCQYSLDGTTWSTMPTSPGVAATFTGTMYVRGNNPNGWADDSNFARFTFGGSGHVTLSGSLLSLIDNGAGTATTVPTGTYFVSLFGNGYNASHTLWDPDTCIVDASGLVLNNANVSGGVYASLFRNCQSLILAPALPTITLASFCYQYMFEGCSSLITAPALSATTLAGHCYEGMFRNCTHLEGPVNISANSPRADVNACAFMFINSGIARVGTNRIIYVGGNVSQWNYDNCGIDSNYWTVQ